MTGPSVLDYARHHRLSLLQSNSDLSKHIQQLSCTQAEVDTLPDLKFPSREELVSDLRLQTSHEAAGHLAQMIKPPDAVSSERVLNNPFWLRELRMETSLLVSDHDKDMRWFKKPLKIERIIRELRDDCDISTPPFRDESAFLKQCRRAAEMASLDAHQPRLDITDAALALLTRSTDDRSVQVNLDEVYEACLRDYKRAPDPLTPLLTPPMHPVAHELPSDAADWILDPRSDQDVPYDNFMSHLEQHMEEMDQIYTSDIGNGSPTTVRQILAEATTTPGAENTLGLRSNSPPNHPRTKKRIDASSLKLEVPLTNLPLPDPEVDETKIILDHFIRDFIEFPEFSDGDSDRDLALATIQNQLDQCKSHVTAAIDKEPPIVSEALLRLDVPVPADPLTGKFDSVSLLSMSEENGISVYYTNPEDEARLNWIPFPAKLMRPDLRESLQPISNNQEYIKVPEKVTQSHQLLWKGPGLRILINGSESDEDLAVNHTPDEEVNEERSALAETSSASQKQPDSCDHHEIPAIAPGKVPQGPLVVNGTSLPTIFTQLYRSITSSQMSLSSNDEASGPSQVDSRPFKRPRLNTGGEAGTTFGKARSSTFNDDPASFSASGSLASFLDLRGKKVKRPSLPGIDHPASFNTANSASDVPEDPIESSQQMTGSAPFASSTGTSPEQSTNCRIIDCLESPQYSTVTTKEVQIPSTPEPPYSPASSTIPTAEAITHRRVIILNESLVQNRPLMSLLDAHSDSPLQTIYRPLAKTIDIILNPTTALILTNLQALKQKSLPGAGGQTPYNSSSSSRTLHDRLRAAAPQYDTIYILISSTAILLNASVELVTAFTAFCTAFKAATGTDVWPIWIPANPPSLNRKDMDPLGAWTWRLIVQYGMRVGREMAFIDDVTLWELFLREVGLNALAAQVVLGMLKKGGGAGAVGKGEGDVESWGLKRLVAMSGMERREMFGELLGEKCLVMLNEALDAALLGP